MKTKTNQTAFHHFPSHNPQLSTSILLSSLCRQSFVFSKVWSSHLISVILSNPAKNFHLSFHGTVLVSFVPFHFHPTSLTMHFTYLLLLHGQSILDLPYMCSTCSFSSSILGSSSVD